MSKTAIIIFQKPIPRRDKNNKILPEPAIDKAAMNADLATAIKAELRGSLGDIQISVGEALINKISLEGDWLDRKQATELLKKALGAVMENFDSSGYLMSD